MINRIKLLVRVTFLIVIAILPLSLVGCKNTVEEEFVIPENAIVVDAKISDVYGNADAIVTIISDDGFNPSGLYFNALMKAYELKGTVAGVVCFIEPCVDDWKEICNEGYVEVVNHSYTHTTMMAKSWISYNYFGLMHEIVDSKKYLENQFGTEQIVFVCPENQMCPSGYNVLLNNGYWAVRRGVQGFNSLSPDEGFEPGQWYNLYSMGIMDPGIGPEERDAWIDYAIDNKVWLIEMWHNVLPEDDGMFQTILIDDAKPHLSYLSELVSQNKIWVASFTEAVKYIREKQNSCVIAYVLDNELHINVKLISDDMSYSTFNQPLTVEVVLPTTNETMYYDVIPGAELIVVL